MNKPTADKSKRHRYGKLNGKKVPVTGICEKEPGPNLHLGIPLQTTINRMPVTLGSIDEIKILE